MKRMLGGALFGLLVAGFVCGQNVSGNDQTPVASPPAIKLITGQCHCGYLKYEALGPVVKCSHCDCHGCQRATGTLKAPFVTVHRAGFKITDGKVSEFRAKSGEKCDASGGWSFCPKCGTQLFWKGDKGEDLDLFAGTLDDTSLFKPTE